jgi:CBS-domain-containing membrane protein
LGHLFQETSHHGFVVLNEKQELCGVVTIADLEQALIKNTPRLYVSDICTKNVLSAFHDDTLDDALHHFGALDVGRIPVVDRLHPQRVVGVLRRADIVRAYSSALVDKEQRDEYLERLRLEAASGVHLHEVQVQRGDRVAGKRLKDLTLPADCIIGSIWRGGRAIVPHGRTRLMVGDRLVLFARDREMPDLQKFIHEGTPED